MGRADKQRVVEAQLFGSYQRRLNHDGPVDEEHRDRITELEDKLRSIGGEPVKVLASVIGRHDRLLAQLRAAPVPMDVGAQYDELERRASE